MENWSNYGIEIQEGHICIAHLITDYVQPKEEHFRDNLKKSDRVNQGTFLLIFIKTYQALSMERFLKFELNVYCQNALPTACHVFQSTWIIGIW